MSLQPSLLDLPQTPKAPINLCDQLARYFKQFPQRDIPTWELAQVAGIGGWRTRLSELRHAPYFMRIENTQRVERHADGSHRRLSFYKFVPEAHA